MSDQATWGQVILTVILMVIVQAGKRWLQIRLTWPAESILGAYPPPPCLPDFGLLGSIFSLAGAEQGMRQ